MCNQSTYVNNNSKKFIPINRLFQKKNNTLNQTFSRKFIIPSEKGQFYRSKQLIDLSKTNRKSMTKKISNINKYF